MEFYTNNFYGKKPENVNKALTFSGLRETSRAFAEKVKTVREQNAAAMKEIREKNIYTVSYIEGKRAEFVAKESATAAECIAEFKEACKKVIDAKKAAVNTMLTQAPTQEQINLLQSLQMQGSSLGKNEIARILPELANNYRALKTMQTIAQKAGFNVTLPPQYDFESIILQIEAAESYLNARASDLGKPYSEWFLDTKCFFGPAEYQDYKWKAIADVLDGNVQTAPVIEAAQALTDGEKDILKSLFGNKYGEDLKAAVNKAAETPAIADLISRSEYAEHLNEAANN